MRQRGWCKSSYSENVGACLEVLERSRIRVRDSKSSDPVTISFSAGAWTAFVKSMLVHPIAADRTSWSLAHSQSPCPMSSASDRSTVQNASR
ncbi:DUF397 domain-containing protein [Streptomyces sp. NPDC059070]|uniref:DUF397 domain-containing protein n=1 Tax=Streptomyces sp. NPDC059070 TaxID=3346713 RepID=UPI003695563C